MAIDNQHVFKTLYLISKHFQSLKSHFNGILWYLELIYI